uniref:Uncharacterized protein n=1 Tax=Ditylum brightwellii TaxID=49249 RepID=A0A7S4SXQ5_9STRA
MKFCAALLGSLLLTGSTSAFQTSRGPSAFARHVKPLQAVIDYTENAQRDVYTMDEWASGNGVQKANGFQLTSDNGWDYYAMTTADIPAGTPVLYVPTSMILSAQRISDELGSSLQQAEQFLSSNEAGNQLPLFRLMVKILVEYEKGTQSTFYPWLNSLPRFFANGVSMTGESNKELSERHGVMSPQIYFFIILHFALSHNQLLYWSSRYINMYKHIQTHALNACPHMPLTSQRKKKTTLKNFSRPSSMSPA